MLSSRHLFCGFWLALLLAAPAQVVLRNEPPAAGAMATVAAVPRPPLPPSPLRIDAPGDTHRVTVKFIDQLRARALADGRLSIVAARPPAGLPEAVTTHDLRFTKSLRTPDATLEAMTTRARLRTGRAQPDLPGMHAVFEGEAATALAIATGLQALPCIEWVRIVSIDSPPPPPGDIAPVTPDLEPNQGHRNPDPGFDVDATFAAGALGHGIRFTDVEYGFNANHEDLVDAGITDESTGTPNSQVYSLGYDDHGTAALGVTAAPDNGYGVTGMAPGADFRFFGEWLTTGWNRPAAVAAALAASGPGDVVLLEMQSPYGAPDGDYGPAELDPAVWTLVQAASDAGVIVVAAAGNGGLDLDHSDMDYYTSRGNSGAIIVGAGTNNINHDKISYSTYGTRVDVQAWGSLVLTTGYGSYAEYGGDPDQSYHWFGGTSSASACVAGAVTALQSHAVATLQTRLGPAEMRELLVATGHPQGSGGAIGPALDLSAALTRINALAPISITAVRRSGPTAEIDFNSVSGVSYRLEGNIGTDPGDWTTLETGFPGNGATATFTIAPPGDPDFYIFRIVAEVDTTASGN